jgi:peptidoglycan hydrolase-like protein with peptidoglycan-binding domain
MKLKKVSALVLAIAFVFTSIGATKAEAATTYSTTTSVAEVQKLLEQIASLQAQLETIQKQQGTLTQELKQTISIARELRRGMTSEEVKILQEILATDPDIYPEGLITGMFGPLTEKAVKKFQQKFGIESVGNVGPKTLAKLNELLKEGTGNSGKVPPGLLIAPGIAKKLGFNPAPLPGQKLPPGIAKKIGNTGSTTPDTMAPVLSAITATSTASTTGTVSWTTNEISSGKLWFGTTTPVGTTTSPTMSQVGFTLSHSFSLTNLTASTTYYYVVSSADVAGNNATSTERTFVNP